jgi:hypothetical protein
MSELHDPSWYYKAHWRDLSDDYLVEVEKRCKNLHFSYAGMLGPDESLCEVLERDEKTLEENNVTHRQIADVLETLHLECNHKPTSNGSVQHGKYNVYESVYRGAQTSPFQHSDDSGYYGYGSGDRDIRIIRTSDDKEFRFGHLLIHMIRYNGFFEGTGTSYRVDPQEVIDFFEIKPEVDYSVTWKPHKYITMSMSTGAKEDERKTLKFFEAHALEKIEVDGHFIHLLPNFLDTYINYSKYDDKDVDILEILVKEMDAKRNGNNRFYEVCKMSQEKYNAHKKNEVLKYQTIIENFRKNEMTEKDYCNLYLCSFNPTPKWKITSTVVIPDSMKIHGYNFNQNSFNEMLRNELVTFRFVDTKVPDFSEQ